MIKDIQLFDSDGINFVEYVENGDISSVAFDNVNELIDSDLKEGRDLNLLVHELESRCEIRAQDMCTSFQWDRI